VIARTDAEKGETGTEPANAAEEEGISAAVTVINRIGPPGSLVPTNLKRLFMKQQL
jgi:hypothetical protein